jgi:hypothetical protein
MLFKTNLIEILLLLVVIFSFAWISVHKQMVVSYNSDIIENMDTATESETETEVPKCSGHSSVPDCHESVYSDYDPYSYDSKYILKTQVVPPVCPACPSVINNHSHGDNLYDGLVKDNSGTILASSSTEINQQAQVSNSSNREYNSVTNIENTTINNAEAKAGDKSETEVNQPNFSGGKSSLLMSDEILKRQKSFYDRESSSENVSGQCPPCPACERCPEPAFTCEKVINYKSPSSKQYLPMPVLNDFSSFPSTSS